MANIGYATLSVVPSMRGFGARLRTGLSGPLATEATAAGEKSGKTFASSFAKFAVAGTAAIGAIKLGKSFVDAAVESQKVTKQTEAVLKSMGNQAGLTSSDIAKLAEKQSLLSGVDDEVIQSAQNVLLTFGKVRNEVGKGNDVFNRGSQAALDMSVALKQDLQGATIQIGKALNDPVKGITALSRAGVSFTEQQKEQIKTLVASGKTLDAQKIILSELENQFGGSAKAQATAGERLKVAFGNIQEEIGKRLLPVVEALAGWLADRLPGAMEAVGRAAKPVIGAIKQIFGVLFQRDFKGGGPFAEDSKIIDGLFKFRDLVAEIVPKVVNAFKKLATFIVKEVLPAFVKIGKWVIEHRPVLIGLAVAIGVGLVAAFVSWAAAAVAAAAATIAAAAPVILIGAAIAGLVAGIIYAYENWDIFRTAVDAVARFLKDKLWPALKAIADFFVDNIIPIIGRVVEAFIGWHRRTLEIAGDVIEAIAGIVDFVIDLPGTLAQVGRNMWGWLGEGFEFVANGILAAFEDMINFVLDGINLAIQAANDANLFLNFLDVDKVDPVSLPRVGVGSSSKGLSGAGRNWGSGFPKFALGGVMPGIRGVHYPALVAGGETVVPTHDRTAMAAGSWSADAGWPDRGESVVLQVTQYPGEDQVSAGMRALRWHQQTKTALASR